MPRPPHPPHPLHPPDDYTVIGHPLGRLRDIHLPGYVRDALHDTSIGDDVTLTLTPAEYAACQAYGILE